MWRYVKAKVLPVPQALVKANYRWIKLRVEIAEEPTYRIRTIGRIDTSPVEQKTDSRELLALTIAEGVHELGEGGGSFDLEEDLVVVVSDFDVEVLRLRLVLRVAASAR